MSTDNLVKSKKKKATMKKSTPSPSSSSKTKQTNHDHKPSLLQQHFEDTVRPCIDLIDSLRSLGVDKDLSLPAIAVIGDQSSGKSSVLEALSGVALPRGSGIVTRCPLELKMRKTMKGDQWQGRISYNVHGVSLKSHSETIDDPSQVEQLIKQAQDEMAGVGVGISEDLISLEIASPDVPDLTLIDLPGIARVAVQGQPVNIGDQIKRLIQKVIAKQQTICLVVVPCNVDIATTEALKMAQEVDGDGERTLGILTKPDLVDRGTEQTAVDIVHNKVIPLKKGYMIVRCRGQQEIVDQVSLMEVTRREKVFFKEHTHFRTLYDDGQASIPKLAEKLTLELVNHIERSLPALEKEITMKLSETQHELDRCGSGPPSDPEERLHFLFDRVMAFTRNVISLTKGEEIKCGDNVFAILREEFGKWSDHIDISGINFNRKIEKEVATYEKKYRGKELPGFINYKTFETMVQEQIKLLEEPAVQKLRDIADLVKKVLIELAQLSFVGFPNLIKVAKTKIEDIKQQKEPAAESMLRTQFKMEMIIYTQDRTYSSALKRRKLDYEAVNGSGSSFAALSKQLTSKTCLGSEATLSELMFHLKSYYEIASQRLADQIPMVIRFHILEETAAQLQRDMLQMLQDKHKTEFLLHEDSGVNDRRTTLQNRLKRLMQARTRLLEF